MKDYMNMKMNFELERHHIIISGLKLEETSLTVVKYTCWTEDLMTHGFYLPLSLPSRLSFLSLDRVQQATRCWSTELTWHFSPSIQATSSRQLRKSTLIAEGRNIITFKLLI